MVPLKVKLKVESDVCWILFKIDMFHYLNHYYKKLPVNNVFMTYLIYLIP